jgi:hypothetical protein
MAWEVQHFQYVEVIRHNGQLLGYTADMFLVLEETHPPMQVARYKTLQVIWNAAIAYALLVALPIAFEANISTVIPSSRMLAGWHLSVGFSRLCEG